MDVFPEQLLPAVHHHQDLEQGRGAVSNIRRTPGGSEQRGRTGEV